MLSIGHGLALNLSVTCLLHAVKLNVFIAVEAQKRMRKMHASASGKTWFAAHCFDHALDRGSGRDVQSCLDGSVRNESSQVAV